MIGQEVRVRLLLRITCINVDNLCREVEENWSSEVVSLFPTGLGGRTGGIKLPFVYGSLFVHCVRSVKEVLWWNCHSSKTFSRLWTGCDLFGEGCVERK